MRRFYQKPIFALIVYFLAVITLRGWLGPSYILIYFGYLAGLVMPYLDFFLYAFIIKPDSNYSKSLRNVIDRRDLKSIIPLFDFSKVDKNFLIIYSALFQIVLFVLALFITTSSASHFGRGVVLSFYASVCIKYIYHYLAKDDISFWFSRLNLNLEDNEKFIFFIATLLSLTLLGFWF